MAPNSTVDLYIVPPDECRPSALNFVAEPFTLPPDMSEGACMWALNIAKYVDLGDERRRKRLAKILAAFACDPQASIPKNTENGIGLDSTYEFFKNQHFTLEDLIEGIGTATAFNCADLSKVYVVQDTTSYNFTNLKQTTGLGPINDSAKARGLHAHNTIVVDDQGVVRGLLHIKFWARNAGVKIDKTKDNRSFEEKESYKWMEGLHAARDLFDLLPDEVRPRLIHVMDREADIHEVLQEIAERGDSAIIRCAQNRKIDGEVELAHQAVHATRSMGSYTVNVKGKEHKARKAKVEVRAITVTLTPNQKTYPGREPLTVNLVEAREIDPPKDCKPICWRLWTFEPVDTFEQAVDVILGYCERWRVEEVHLTVKSGCQVERLELETADRLARAITLYTAVAVRIVNLRDLCKRNPEAPCTVVLSDEEWRVLQAQATKKTVTADTTPPTIRQATLWIGKLGGHQNRKCDGLPGVRTLWQGLQALHILIKGSRVERAGLVDRSPKQDDGENSPRQRAAPVP